MQCSAVVCVCAIKLVGISSGHFPTECGLEGTKPQTQSLVQHFCVCVLLNYLALSAPPPPQKGGPCMAL
jgi:hypothetical protein